MPVGTVNPLAIKTGPGKIYYAPLATAIPAFTATASKVTGTWTSWVGVGSTDEGLTYNESTDTENITVAESLYPVSVVTTGKSGTISFSMAEVSSSNWKLAANGGTVTITGATTTLLHTYVPPLVGQEVRVMMGFHSYDDTEVIIWPQVFNSGGFETPRSTVAAKAVLPVTFSVELPDPAVLTTPYKRWVSGGLAV
jgi:hypothetical protein